MARTSISALARWCRSILAARSACWAAATAVSPWMARCARPAVASSWISSRRPPTCATTPRPGRTTAPSGSAARRRWTSPAAPPVAWTLTVAATARRRQAAASCWAARWTGTRRASPIAPVISPSWCAGRRAGRLGLAPGHRHAARQPPGTLDLAGDGGQIVLKSSYGLFLDGDMRAGGRRGRGRRHAGAGAGNAHVPAVGQRRGRRAPAARTDPVAGHAGQRPGIGSRRGSSIRRCIMARRACRRGSSRPAASATCRCWSTAFSVSTATWPWRPRKACASMPAAIP